MKTSVYELVVSGKFKWRDNEFELLKSPDKLGMAIVKDLQTGLTKSFNAYAPGAPVRRLKQVEKI